MTWAPALLFFLATSSDHFADLNGARIHYTSEGSGAMAILQIHGWACNGTFFRLQAPALAQQRYRVISIDLPGHGQSDAPTGIDYTIEHFAAAVSAVSKHAGIDKAAITFQNRTKIEHRKLNIDTDEDLPVR